MNMSLDIPIPFDTIEDEGTGTSRTYAIDWENGMIGGFVDSVEAIKQFIKKALITPRFKCLIYDNQYGSEIKETVLDKNVTREYLEAEIPFLVEDALVHDERVLQVYNIEITFGESYPLQDSVIVTFDVDTIYGKIPVEEVI